MTYNTPTTITTNDLVTASYMNTYWGDNIIFLKSLTDYLFPVAYNNDGDTLNAGDLIIFDPAYVSGLGVKTAAAANDMRVAGVVKDASITSHASGLICTGPFVMPINVTGAVVFGHSLVASATPHYAMDSGGGGWGPGVVGFALEANVSGTATINALIKPYPLYYALASSIARTQTKNNVAASSGSQTAIASAISDGVNRLMLVFIKSGAADSAALFNGDAFTAFQYASGSGNQTFAYLIPSAATANITFTKATNGYVGCAVAVILNGINQSTPVRTYADNTGTSATASVIVPSNPGDLVIAGFSCRNTYTVATHGAGQTSLADIVSSEPMRLTVDSKIATGATTTFTWDVSASIAWEASGVAVVSL